MAEATQIFILDDDMDIRFMMQSILKYSGYTVDTCSSPDELFALLSKTKPRLILMDMLLSGHDGREVCRNLKNSQQFQHIPVIMISAHPDAEITCRQAGANGFLEKPFDMDVFTDKVKTLMAEPA